MARKLQWTIAIARESCNRLEAIPKSYHSAYDRPAVFIPNKKQETIIGTVNSVSDKILIDNGDEWNNKIFILMCDCLNIDVKTMEVNSSYSNKIVGRDSQNLDNMVDKTTRATKCSFELNLSWALSSKNSLQNVAGFSPFQFALWKKTKTAFQTTGKPKYHQNYDQEL